MVDTTIELFPRELDSRSADGLEVTLLWSKPTNALTVAVNDTRTGEASPSAPTPRTRSTSSTTRTRTQPTWPRRPFGTEP